MKISITARATTNDELAPAATYAEFLGLRKNFNENTGYWVLSVDGDIDDTNLRNLLNLISP